MDKKRAKRKKDEYTGPGGAEEEVVKPTKDEYGVAKWIRRNVPTKRTKFLNHNVEYFTSAKALDGLMESKFAKGDAPLFPSREIAIDFLDSMLIHKFFHRAKKVPVTEQELRGRTKAAGKDSAKDGGAAKKEVKQAAEEKGTDGETSHAEGRKDTKSTEKKKRKIRLDMHPEQVFVDGSEAYVWIYDPIPMHYWLIGALLVVGAIVLCLFPLWPAFMRKGVYYLSIAAAGFLTFILGLAVLRFIVFCLIWVVTGGKYHFWLFPNLTEDVGFFASFWPLYKYEYRPNGEKPEKSKSKSKKAAKKDKDSDAEDETIKTVDESQAKGDQLDELPRTPKRKQVHADVAAPLPVPEDEQPLIEEEEEEKVVTEEKSAPFNVSESESEGSNPSSTGKDFELVDSHDVDTS